MCVYVFRKNRFGDYCLHSGTFYDRVVLVIRKWSLYLKKSVFDHIKYVLYSAELQGLKSDI